MTSRQGGATPSTTDKTTGEEMRGRDMTATMTTARSTTDTQIAFVKNALDALTGTSCPDAIFDADFRTYGPAREVLGTRGTNALSSEALTPFSEPQFEVHEVKPTAAGLTATVTFRGRQTGVYQGIAPSGRRFEGTGVVAFHLKNGRIADATSMLQWRPLAAQAHPSRPPSRETTGTTTHTTADIE